MASRTPPEIRFMRRVEKQPEDGCWIWTGGLYKKLYGVFAFSKKRIVYAHRASFELFVGTIAEGLEILHKCDNPPCVRPDHLFQGTQADNVADCISKNRNIRGEMCHAHVLNEDDVQMIRANPHLSTNVLAEILSVTYDTVYYVQRRLTWRHVA